MTTITKTGVTNAYDAGAFGSLSMGTGEFHTLDITVQDLTNAYNIGLSNGNGGEFLNDCDFSWFVNVGVARVRENADEPTATTAVVAGDKLTIHIGTNNKVVYYKNDVVFYTSTKTPTFPLNIDLVIFHASSTIEGVLLDNSNASFQEGVSKVDVSFDYDTGFMNTDMLVRQPNFDHNDFDNVIVDHSSLDNFLDLDFDHEFYDPDWVYDWVDQDFSDDDFTDKFNRYLDNLPLQYNGTDFAEEDFWVFAVRGPDFDTSLGPGFYDWYADMLVKQEQAVSYIMDTRVGLGWVDITYSLDMVILFNGIRNVFMDIKTVNHRTVAMLLDMYIKLEQTLTYAQDMRLVFKQELSPDSDMIVKSFDKSLTPLSDMILKTLGANVNFDNDMILKALFSITPSADMLVQALFSATFGADMKIIIAGLVNYGMDMSLFGADFDITYNMDMTLISGTVSTQTDHQGFIRRGTEDIGYLRLGTTDRGYIRRGTEDVGLIT